MNSSARMRLRAAVLTLTALFVGVCGVAWWAVARPLPEPPDREFATLHLADPIELTEGNTTHRITRVVVNFGKQTLTLERDELAFNDYGDATRIGGPDPLVLSARFRRERVTDLFMGEIPGLTEIAPETRFRQRLRAVELPEAPGTRRLIVLGERRDGDETFERILELRPPVVQPDVLGDDPQPERFTLGGRGHMTVNGYRQLPTVTVSGSLATGGQLLIDRNPFNFCPDGRVGWSYCVAFPPTEVSFKLLGPDPANRGRRAFELVPTKPFDSDAKVQYILVLGPTELSEHRLVVKEDGRVKQVLSLRDTHRDNHLFMLRKLDGVPADERQAFRELGKAVGYRASVEANNGHVVSLHLLEGDMGKLDPILARFPHLASLGFRNAKLPATGLPCLEQLKELRGLDFTSCELTDDGLASVGKATGLRLFHAFGSTGLTPASFRHLAPLTNLESLDLRDENAPRDAPTFDDAVKHFAGMTRLTYLNLQGRHLTDAGLADIGRLTTLRELSVSGPGITDAGLRHLDGLPDLTALSLYSSGVSFETLTAFRKKRPNLRPW